MMNEDAQSLSNESQNFMWRLEGIRFQEETFFLKVSLTEFKPTLVKAFRTIPFTYTPLSFFVGDKESTPWPLVLLCPGRWLDI